MRILEISKRALCAGSALNALALVGVAAGASAVAVAPAYAQDYTNVNATGRIVSTDGTPVAGATVTIVSDDQGFTRTTTTDSNGSYRFAQIPPGNYTFTVEAPNFNSYTESGVELSQTGASNQIALSPLGDTGVIVVSAGRIQTQDFERTTTGAVIDVADLSERVPVARDLNSIIQLAPGTASGDTTFGNLTSAVGSSVSENVFYLNGLNITEFREGLGSVTVPFDFYRTVEVKNGGYPAEFGRATGAFVNATTKSGSNELHGSIKFNWEPNWDSNSPNTLTRDNDYRFNERTDMIAQLSGPIIKDHLFFYGLYNARNTTNGFAVTSPNFDDEGNVTSVDGTFAYRDTSKSPFWGGKLDAVIVDGQRLEFTYFDTSSRTVRTINEYVDPATNEVGDYVGTSIFELGGENYVGRYTGNFFDWLTVSAAYGKYNNRDNTVPTDQITPYVSEERFGSPTAIGNPVNAIETQEDSREFYRADVDVYVDLFGEHHFRGGYDREDLTSLNTITYTGGVAYTLTSASNDDPYDIPEGTEYVSARTFVNGGTFKSRNEAFYLEDSWSLLNDRLTLQFGVRADKFIDENIEGDVYYDSGWNWQPRLGATLDPTGTGRTKVYGSFGRYYLPIAVNTNIRLGGAELDYDQLYELNGLTEDNQPILGDPIAYDPCPVGGGNNCVLRNDGSVSPLDTVVASNLKNQSVDEYILGAEQRVGDRWVFGIYGTYRSLNASLEDAAIDQGILTYCSDNDIAVADCGGYLSDGVRPWFYGARQYTLINPGESVTVTPAREINGSLDPITLTPEQLGYPAAKRTYKAITVTFEREFDGVWGLQGSYTYGKNKGNIEGGVKSDNGQTDSGLSTDFDFPSLMLGSYGYLPNDRRHVFKAYGSYSPTDWLTVGANVAVTSPRRFGCIGLVSGDVSPGSGVATDYGYAYGAAGNFCVVDDQGNIVTNPSGAAGLGRSLVPRGSSFKSDWNKTLDLDFLFKLPTDFDAGLRVSVFNVLNTKSKLDFNEFGTNDAGTPRGDYGAVTNYQSPRSVRMQLTVGF